MELPSWCRITAFLMGNRTFQWKLLHLAMNLPESSIDDPLVFHLLDVVSKLVAIPPRNLLREAMVVPCRFRTLRTLEVFEREGPERHRDALSVDESPSANPGLSQKMQLPFERKEMGGRLDHFFIGGYTQF